MVWWQKSYINRRDWILENQGSLKLQAEQLLILLMIDFMNGTQELITLESLANRCGLDVTETDTRIQELVRAQILNVVVKKDGVTFSIDNLFKDGVVYEYVDEDIFKVFETEFGRLLSQPELQTLNTWLRRYTEPEILEALRSAMVYKKLSMQYINSILVNNKKEAAAKANGR